MHALRPGTRTVCDPACGDGRFLSAAAAVHLSGEVGLHSFGGDLAGRPADAGEASVVEANTLVAGLATWPDAPAEGFDLVIGNPPFRGQLREETWLRAEERAQLIERYGDVARGYVDTASLFLVAACEMAAPTGRVAFIMPMSFLAARDAAPARRRVLELATLEGLWICPDFVFPDAQVQVCAVILDRSGPRKRPVRRWVGEDFDPIEPAVVDSDQLMDAPTWSHLAAPAFGVPEVALESHGTLSQLVTATAGFRDEYYGLAELVCEAPDPTDGGSAPVITSGLIDPGAIVWGHRSARIARRDWTAPTVRLGRIDTTSSLGRWVAARRHPKLLVATQTKVIEAAPDPDGNLVPLTPVIAVHAAGEELWRALAVLLAPPVTAHALSRYLGVARSAGAIKLSASQVLDLPLPVDQQRWDDAARVLADAHDPAAGGVPRDAVLAAATRMTEAYRCDHGVLGWWMRRLPRVD